MRRGIRTGRDRSGAAAVARAVVGAQVEYAPAGIVDEVADRIDRGWLQIDDHVVGSRRVSLDTYVLTVRGPLLALSDAIGQHWFADPVTPTLIGGF